MNQSSDRIKMSDVYESTSPRGFKRLHLADIEKKLNLDVQLPLEHGLTEVSKPKVKFTSIEDLASQDSMYSFRNDMEE